ncbi:hypothetical protein KSP39_PZI024266 [Platanthera zijinensis]|uniref:Uncharacterized protein n=1 Tax=Platanthera zijinensis TaxID=2320716 RepID=A0AAP0AUA4_9ASPA
MASSSHGRPFPWRALNSGKLYLPSLSLHLSLSQSRKTGRKKNVVPSQPSSASPRSLRRCLGHRRCSLSGVAVDGDNACRGGIVQSDVRGAELDGDRSSRSRTAASADVKHYEGCEDLRSSEGVDLDSESRCKSIEQNGVESDGWHGGDQ